MKLGVLFSGGKDSCLALHKAIKEGHEVKYLLSIIPENPDSFMFHKPCLQLLKRQAKELSIDLVTKTTKGEKEKELDDLEELISVVKDKVEGICVGGIASTYQGNQIKKICDKLGLKFIALLWNYTSEKIWEELFDEGFKVIITKIACEGIPKEMAGKIITEKNFEKLKKLSEKYKFRLDFEGGEAETAVLFMPEFKEEIKIEFNVESESEFNHLLKLKKVL